jgi:hypothetical protein
MKYILMLGCFSAVPMVKSDWDQKNGFITDADAAVEGYELTNVATGRRQWLPQQEVDGTSTALPDNFIDHRPEDRPWIAERALHAQRIQELEAEMARRKLHYQQNGTTDTFAQNFIEPHIEALRQRVAELTDAIRCID